MGWFCSSSEDAAETVEPANDSAEVETISVPCAENKIMYFNTSETGFWRVRRGHSTSGTIVSLPQYLKVEVDGPKSCQGERYYFTILEGPLVARGQHFNEVQAERRGNVVKTYNGQNVLIENNPHTAACAITVSYTSHRILTDYSGYNAASVEGEFTFAGATKLVRMQLDVIEPNTAWNISIADYPHSGGNNYNANLSTVWFRIDAPTSPVDWTGHGLGSDRYFHLGRGSAGCFTNVSDGGQDSDWDAIADALMKCRDASGNLYAGTVTLQIPSTIYEAIRQELIAASSNNNLPYVWANRVITP